MYGSLLCRDARATFNSRQTGDGPVGHGRLTTTPTSLCTSQPAASDTSPRASARTTTSSQAPVSVSTSGFSQTARCSSSTSSLSSIHRSLSQELPPSVHSHLASHTLYVLRELTHAAATHKPRTPTTHATPLSIHLRLSANTLSLNHVHHGVRERSARL